MSSGLTLLVSLALLGQTPPEGDIFRDGKISVRRQVDANGNMAQPILRHVLYINDTYFGSTILADTDDNPLRRKPTTYYHRNGPVGFLFRSVDPFPDAPFASDAVPPARLVLNGAVGPLFALAVPWSEPAIGVVGMHSGTIASYVKPFQTIHFYERNPAIAKLSLPAGQEKPYFHNISDARKRGGQVSVIAGDVRASIDKAPKGYYKFLFVEMCQRIYLEDVEVELITKEGIKACVDSLAPGGVACFHTSNRYLGLAPLVCGAAKSWKFAAREVNDNPNGRMPRADDHFSSAWIFISREEARLKELGESPLRGPWSWSSQPGFEFFWTDKGYNPLLKGTLRDDPRPGRIVNTVLGPLYKILPPSWSRYALQWAADFTHYLSRTSLARMERQNVSAEWLRKTP